VLPTENRALVFSPFTVIPKLLVIDMAVLKKLPALSNDLPSAILGPHELGVVAEDPTSTKVQPGGMVPVKFFFTPAESIFCPPPPSPCP